MLSSFLPTAGLIAVWLLPCTAVAQAAPAHPRTAASTVTLTLPEGLPPAFRLRLPLAGTDLDLRLTAHSSRTADFTLWTSDAVGQRRRRSAPPPRTYRGTVTGHAGWAVAASLEPDGLYAVLVRPDQPPLVIEPDGHGRRRHRVATWTDFDPARCGTTAGHRVAPPAGGAARSSAARSDPRMACEIAYDCDFEFYQSVGSSTAGAVAAIERAMEASNLIFERDADIVHRITAIVVRTAEPDPYSGNDARSLLTFQFRNEWQTNQAHIDRDIAHLVTDRPMGNILGIAYLGVVCSPNFGYGVTRFGRGFNSDLRVLTHEIGHNWDAQHCVDPCDVMCRCSADSGFGPNNSTLIRNHRDSRACLLPARPELVAHWRGDDAGGATTIADSGPHGLDGTPNGIRSGVAGARPASGTALRFRGDGGHVQVADQPPLADAREYFTVAAWVKPNSFGGTRILFGSDTGWRFGLFGDRMLLEATRTRAATSSQRLTAGTWTHLAVRFANLKVSFFVDGVLQESLSLPQLANAPTAHWFLGAAGAGGSSAYAGDLDDLQVYDGALDDAEIAWLHGHPGDARCRAGWKRYGSGLAGAQGVPSLDVAGSLELGRPLTLVVGPVGTSPVLSGALAFGLAPANTPLLGGQLLVDLGAGFATPIYLNNFGTDVAVPVPNTPGLACTPLHLQVFAIDGGAPQGVAMTAAVRVLVD